MTKAAGGIIDVTDLPAVGTALDIVANTADGWTAGLATATVFIGGTHVVLGGTLTRNVALTRGTTIGTLPVGTRPSQARRVVCALGTATPSGDQSGTTAIAINTDGTMFLSGATAAISSHRVVYLDAIMFPI